MKTKPHRGILIDQIPADGAAGLMFTSAQS